MNEAEATDHHISRIPELDPNNPADEELLLQYPPKTDDLKLMSDITAEFGSEEANAELWE